MEEAYGKWFAYIMHETNDILLECNIMVSLLSQAIQELRLRQLPVQSTHWI